MLHVHTVHTVMCTAMSCEKGYVHADTICVQLLAWKLLPLALIYSLCTVVSGNVINSSTLPTSNHASSVEWMIKSDALGLRWPQLSNHNPFRKEAMMNKLVS